MCILNTLGKIEQGSQTKGLKYKPVEYKFGSGIRRNLFT